MNVWKIFAVICLMSCSKESQTNVRGKWLIDETVYDFSDELIITHDGESENFCYYISNDSIYLDYGFPFVIEFIDQDEMVLSKMEMIYEFDRIE